MDKTEELQKVKNNISENARRVKSTKSLYIRPQSSITHASSRFYRSKMKETKADKSE
jgi:hypothetical protein